MELNEAIAHAREVAKDRNETANLTPTVYGDYINSCRECAREHEQLASWLEELEQRREADKWIPVSEKLPEKDGKFLICTASGFVESSIFMFGKFSIPYVIAWKSLPKPYESEDK